MTGRHAHDRNLEGLVPGWRFSISEISAGVFEVRGFDEAGRQVSRRGANSGQLVDDAVADAHAILAQLRQ